MDTVVAGLQFREEEGSLVVVLSGDWNVHVQRPSVAQVVESLGHGIEGLRFDVQGLGKWDSALLIFVRQCRELADARRLSCHTSGLPIGVQSLMELSLAAPQQSETARMPPSGIEALGNQAILCWQGLWSYLGFMGQLILDLRGFALGRIPLRLKEFVILLQDTGVRALPIVSLLSFLTGLIIAFIGVVQLQKFAADIYVADLVGLSITRELGAVMAGVIMAGRTGAAFAAQIGSMRVNEEIDALISFGISPIQFLVLPRVIALVLMMPLLCACADFVGIMGGMVVAVSISDVSIVQYFNQIERAVDLTDLFTGIFKSGFFGAIIALAGCFRGLNCGKDATSVGVATTSAVVTAITWIVISDAIFAVLFHVLGL